jgi:hypothetical protein
MLALFTGGYFPTQGPAFTGGAFLFRLGETRTGVYPVTLGSHAATGLTNEQQLVHLCLNRSRPHRAGVFGVVAG